MSEPIPWHRLFGLTLVDYFRDMPVSVELEKDLSLKQQLLDVAIIHKNQGDLPCQLPDGFDNYLAPHNLVSFKSFHEPLGGWALNELIGHYVNYRKQISPSMKDLLPETDFRVFAVSVRSTEALARQTTLTAVQPGVYHVRHFTGVIRLIVIHELPETNNNALLHLFSASVDQVRYGTLHYQQRSAETSTLLRQLFQRYQLEASLMPTGMEQLKQFAKETIEELLRELTPEERLKGIPAEERLKGLPTQERLKGLSPEQLLAALSPEDRLAMARLLKSDGSSSSSPATDPEGDRE